MEMDWAEPRRNLRLLPANKLMFAIVAAPVSKDQ
jgi:hypothetical protein